MSNVAELRAIIATLDDVLAYRLVDWQNHFPQDRFPNGLMDLHTARSHFETALYEVVASEAQGILFRSHIGDQRPP